MKKRPAKKNKSTPEYDSKREHNVILEKIYSEIKTLGEGQSYLSEKVEKMDKTLLKLDSKSFSIEMNIQAIKSQTGTIDIKVDRIEKELETVKAAIKDVDSRIGEKVAAHENRIQKLEAVR